ncbi:MAG: helix-turn-helix transcriptional regulator [Inquilinaceae bacterium]
MNFLENKSLRSRIMVGGMLDREREDPVVDALYEAGTDTRHLEAALSRWADFSGAYGVVIFAGDNRSDARIAGIDSWGYREDAEQRYLDGYVSSDLLRIGALRAPPDRWYDATSSIDPDSKRRNPFFCEFLPWIGTRAVAGARILVDDRVLTLALHRDSGAGEFEASELAAFDGLIPHFKRFDRLRRISARLEDRVAGLEAALDRLPQAVLIVGQGERVECANAAAQCLLAANDGVCLRSGRLMFDDSGSAARLRQHVKTALRAGAAGAGDLAVPRPSGRPAYRVSVLPLAEASFYAERPGDPKVMIVIIDRDTPLGLGETRLAALFGLTPAEARLAEALGSGLTLAAVATRHRVARSTLRSQLLAVFAKTGTDRQSDLVRLLATLATAGAR